MTINRINDFWKTQLTNITKIGNPVMQIKLPKIQRLDIQSIIQPNFAPIIQLTQNFTHLSSDIHKVTLTNYEIFKKSTENISERLLYLFSKIVKKEKKVKLEEIRKITKRLDSIDSKNANEITVEITTKYRVDSKLSDDELEELSSSKPINIDRILALIGVFLGVLSLIIPKGRERIISTLIA